jgi:hypothetical protein
MVVELSVAVPAWRAPEGPVPSPTRSNLLGTLSRHHVTERAITWFLGAGEELSKGPVSGTLNDATPREERVMRAKTGDHIVIETSKLDTRRRHGDVLEVLGEQDNQHYRVRWDDGHESIYFPGPDAQLRPAD